MSKVGKDRVLELAKECGVKFVRLQFTDIFGALKNIAVTVEQLKKALDGELMFDGSSIEGFVRIEESDMYLRPDPDTFIVLPWRTGSAGNSVARMICDVYNPDGTPFVGCPRNTLKKMIKRAAELGYIMNVGPEIEFFLFHTDEAGKPTLNTHDKAGYFDLAPVDRGEDARRDMVLILEELGFEVEASHHEVAPGQHEIDFKYDNALAMADKIATFRYVVKTVAHKHGLHATFMPKPVFGINGSGMHTNQSLFKDGKNIFYDPAAPDGLSEIAKHYIGGLLKHARGMAAITNPTVNSYKRLVPGYEAPVYIAWSSKNRSPLIRIPAKRGISTRVELRNPDPSCNPYLAIAVMLKAGLEGIKSKITAPQPVECNIYDMTSEECKTNGILSLPANIKEALFELEKDEVIREVLEPHIFPYLKQAMLKEWSDYSMKVHQWETERYLGKY